MPLVKSKQLRNSEYYEKNKDRVSRRKKEFRRKHPEHHAELNRKWKYGLSPEQHKLLLTQQNGLCAACKGPPTGHYGVLVVDHCHESGTVRGLLCNDCNVALGRVKDDAQRLEALAHYVRKFDWLIH